ncbi:uncharacterized protein TM35_000041910 [Trypanosoma theileri]|uniref:Uncharacterized protein n=1 Tax=Trypanosoma theileri TaxID=67003 RepID=A0A1X0P4W0_9TRYP|nr:uncharacterized protein TM35_000041910 [Trypanosoma theileri]ORC91977.1 hypothetical protein TM35_000041910 [Trypanosoma theileri]
MSSIAVGDVVEVTLSKLPPLKVLGVVKDITGIDTALVSLGEGFTPEAIQVSSTGLQRVCAGSDVGLVGANETGKQKIDQNHTIIRKQKEDKLSEMNSKDLLSSSDKSMSANPVNGLRVLFKLLDSLLSWRSPQVTLGVLVCGILSFLAYDERITSIFLTEGTKYPTQFYHLMRTLTILIGLSTPVGKPPSSTSALFILSGMIIIACCEWFYHQEVHLCFVVSTMIVVRTVYSCFSFFRSLV